MREAVTSMKGIKAHVVGDTIVDSYTYTSMIGGMTKTPTISVRFEKKTDYKQPKQDRVHHLGSNATRVTGTQP